MGWPTWREAMAEALYGDDGFFRRERPGDHFRTSVHASDQFAEAFARLAVDCGTDTIVDIGAGRGELLSAIAQRVPTLTLMGVEVAPRPAGLPDPVEWSAEVPPDLTGVLVIANEWLDNVPVDVVEVDDAGTTRIVHVEPTTGAERLGQPVSGDDAIWLDAWWPLADRQPGTRAEIGRLRDEAWASVVRQVRDGVLIAVDYAHTHDDRPPFGTLSAYLDGRSVSPVPDGSRDITAHVALDACAAAGERAGADATCLTTQRHALRSLGVSAGLPPRELATTDPPSYVAALARTSEAAELLDSAGFGGFAWLAQSVGRPLPEVFTASPRT